ncbi:MAG: zf-HC2 domain-containing protein [Actinobacteria bacterium]|nr:zf-HC2 domain-containing protein [Actinomycetota bacterium]
MRRVLQSYLDGELHPVGAIAVADHLDACSTCGTDAGDYRLLKRALARLRTEVDHSQLARLESLVAELTERGAT